MGESVCMSVGAVQTFACMHVLGHDAHSKSMVLLLDCCHTWNLHLISM